MLLNDLNELKTLMDIPLAHTAEDAKLLFLLRMASDWIAELLDRPDLSIKTRTEYYDGTGTKNLLLRCRPVHTSPEPQAFEDLGGYWATASGAFAASTTQLTWGTDFTLRLDPGENGVSRSGILVRIGGVWDRPQARQQGLLSPFITEGNGNVKVVYLAGYTFDSLPSTFRLALAFLVTRLRYVFPLGVELNSDSYEERSISVVISEKTKLLALVKPLLWSHRNWSFGGR